MKGQNTFNNDFGLNLVKGLTNGFGAGFGVISQAAGSQGNQVLGSMFGSQILPGVYTNSMDVVLENKLKN